MGSLCSRTERAARARALCEFCAARMQTLVAHSWAQNGSTDVDVDAVRFVDMSLDDPDEVQGHFKAKLPDCGVDQVRRARAAAGARALAPQRTHSNATLV